MFSFICTWTNDWVNNRDAGDLKCHRIYYDVTLIPYDEKNDEMNVEMSQNIGHFIQSIIV